MKYNIGDVYRCSRGELIEVLEFTDTSCRFRMRDPLTKEPTKYELEGPLENLNSFIEENEAVKIDIDNYIPTGLVEDYPAPEGNESVGE